jgi:hypothetical protein
MKHNLIYRLIIFAVCILTIHLQQVFAQDAIAENTQQVPPPNDRLFVNVVRDVRVTTAVPSAAETEQVFGAKLYQKNIQPVWIQIENLSQETLWFLPFGLDKAYFTPIETSYRRQNRIPILNFDTNQNYYESAMGLRIAAGSKRSGYIFSRVDLGTKSFNIDVMGESDHYFMSFFVPVPGLRLDHYEVSWENLYAEDELVNVDLEGLAAGLEALPCCVTDAAQGNTGDPLNIALVGDINDAYYGFMRAGWDETETIYGGSLWRTISSSVFGNEYRYSPVSALYVFGRPQDVAFQKARSTIDERNHLRLWLSPMRYQGKPVWIGQISRDIGVRLTWKTITTHKIDANVDETREYLLEDLAYAQALAKFGYVRGVGEYLFDSPRGNLTGDPWFTDGLRVVLFLSEEQNDISEIEFLDLGAQP